MFTKTRTGLLIPTHMNEPPTHRCNYPDCDWVGWNAREQVEHVKGHVNADHAEIVEAVKPFSENVVGEGYDPEHQQYLEDRYRKLLPQVGPKEALDPKRYG